jgi:hypothetical protein
MPQYTKSYSVFTFRINVDSMKIISILESNVFLAEHNAQYNSGVIQNRETWEMKLFCLVLLRSFIFTYNFELHPYLRRSTIQ